VSHKVKNEDPWRFLECGPQCNGRSKFL